MTLPGYLSSGELARLIPVIADSRKEQRVASVFLATLAAVPEFAQPLLSYLGVRLGKRSVMDTYTEVVFSAQKETKDRPDGLIVVNTGKKKWRALLEAKIGSAQIDGDQVQRYLQIAKDNGIDAVITLSNQFAARPEHGPVAMPKTLTRHVNLFHWSWKLVLTEAVLLQMQDAIDDPDQAFILREFIRFLSHDSVGVSGFERMPAPWKDVVTLVKSGGPIRKTADETTEIVGAWHQETRDLELRLSQHIATSVTAKLSRAHTNDGAQRLKDDCAQFADKQILTAEFVIPNAASSLVVVADLRTQTIRVSMEVDAPQDVKRGTARVNWLLRQLKDIDDAANVFVRINWPSKAKDSVCRLAELRDDAKDLIGNAPQPPKSFEVFMLSDDGRRFTGRKTFIDELEKVVPEFYDLIAQHLQRWVAKPPKPISVKSDSQENEIANSTDSVVEAEEGKPIKNSGLSPGNQHSVLLDLPPFLQKVIES